MADPKMQIRIFPRLATGLLDISGGFRNPFVMNTDEEIEQALLDLRRGTLVK